MNGYYIAKLVVLTTRLQLLQQYASLSYYPCKRLVRERSTTITLQSCLAILPRLAGTTGLSSANAAAGEMYKCQ